MPTILSNLNNPRQHNANKHPNPTAEGNDDQQQLFIVADQHQGERTVNRGYAMGTDRMDAFLTEDVLQHLAQNVDCRDTLAALCRVSKAFSHAFKPALYKRIWLERYRSSTLASISTLSQETLNCGEELYIGQRPLPDGVNRYDSDHDVEIQALGLLLQKMTNLGSLTIMNPLLSDLEDTVNESRADNDNGEDSDGGENGQIYPLHAEGCQLSPLQYLKRCEKLRHLSLISVEEHDPSSFAWPIPPFRNLRTLVLLGLGRSSFHGNANDIGDVLLLSPELTSLGLSLKSEPGLDNDMLPKLINYYQLRRKEQETPLLKLSKLRLGPGFLPSSVRLNIMTNDYLRELTDLTDLMELQINNWNLGPHENIPYWEIHPKLFTEATRLRRIVVERLSPDIAELIDLLKSPGSEIARLDEIEVSRYFETIKPLEENEEEFFDDFDGKPLYSSPLDQTGNHWRSVSYGTKLKNDNQNMAQHLLQRFVAQCLDLEELSIPMSLEHIKFFKSSVMPKIKRLHTLMMPRGHIADIEFSSVVQTHPTQKNKRIKLDHDREDEERRVELVSDLFALNRHLALQDPDFAPLRYIGIGTHVYCCMLPFLDHQTPPISISIEHTSSTGHVASTEYADSAGLIVTQNYQVVKLSPGQAREFAAIRKLETDDTSFF